MAETIQALLQCYPSLASLDKTLLLAHLLKKDRAFLLTYPEYQPNAAEREAYLQACRDRLEGKPLAYIVHEAGFLGQLYYVDQRVLVPRPETESLVLYVLDTLGSEPLRVVDVGTGSGVIALSLQIARPQWDVTAVDCEQDALDVMSINAKRLGIHTITSLHQKGLGSLKNLDCVVSNPPYITPDDPHLQGDGLMYEPQTALVAHEEGYQVLRDIASEAFEALNSEGVLVMEHGETQDLRPLLHDLGYGSIEVHQDLMGKNRFTSAVKL